MTATAFYRKISAAFLACLLLLTTVVQLSHSHTIARPVAVKQVRTDSSRIQEHCSVPGTDARCFICEYQLVKDGDLPCSILYAGHKSAPSGPCCEIAVSIPSIFNDCFESRGPPACRFI